MYLFRETVQLQGEVEGCGLAVVHGVPPGAATPLSTCRRPVKLLYGHVAVRTPVGSEGHELADRERVKGQLKQSNGQAHQSYSCILQCCFHIRFMENIFNQLSAQGVDLRRVLVQRLGWVSLSAARIPLKYCNLLICLFTKVQ